MRNKRINKLWMTARRWAEAALMSANQSVVYYPEDLSLLGEVLDRIVESLPPKMRTRANLAEIAKNILVCAATGQRDPVELEPAAWINATVIAAAWLMLNMSQTLLYFSGWRLSSITVNKAVGVINVELAKRVTGREKEWLSVGRPTRDLDAQTDPRINKQFHEAVDRFS
jgi:hypothetical protein